MWLAVAALTILYAILRWWVRGPTNAPDTPPLFLQRRLTDEDFCTGLPFYDSFAESPFADIGDYRWFIRQFQPILTTAYDDFLAPGCLLCLDAVWNAPAPLLPTLRHHAVRNLNFAEIQSTIYNALWAGYANNSCSDYGKIRYYCQLLQRHGVFIGTTNLLREVIRRDCVMAFWTLIDIFGNKTTPGTTQGRARFFISLRQHLMVWGSVNIKEFFYDRESRNPGHPTAASLLPADSERDPSVQYLPRSLLIPGQLYVPRQQSEIAWKTPLHTSTYPFQRDLRFVYCPVQTLNTAELRHACKCVSDHGWYNQSPYEDLSDLYVTPLDVY